MKGQERWRMAARVVCCLDSLQMACIVFCSLRRPLTAWLLDQT